MTLAMDGIQPEQLSGLLRSALLAAVSAWFAVAAISKLSRRIDFLKAISAYRLVPALLLTPLSYGLPLVELLVALLLLLPAAMMLGAALCSALLLLFAAGMAINLMKGRRDIDCGCGGRPTPISWGKVGRNLLLAVGVSLASSLDLAPAPGAAQLLAGLAGWLLAGAAFAMNYILGAASAPSSRAR